MSTEYQQLVSEIEQELYEALSALESGELITARQCIDRARRGVVEAWQAKTKS